MKVDVLHPEDHVGDVIGDLNRRRGMIKDQEWPVLLACGLKQTYLCRRCLATSASLRTMTSGRGQFSMEFAHYLPCPQNIATDVIAAAKELKEAK